MIEIKLDPIWTVVVFKLCVKLCVYASKAKEQVHIHHFIFGIPGMLLSWIFFVYGRGWYGLIIAGVTTALFLSELQELLTQDWQP